METCIQKPIDTVGPKWPHQTMWTMSRVERTEKRTWRCATKTLQLLSSKARLAQSVERKALNLVVVGSSPTGGAFVLTYFVRWCHVLTWRKVEMQGIDPCTSRMLSERSTI